MRALGRPLRFRARARPRPGPPRPSDTLDDLSTSNASCGPAGSRAAWRVTPAHWSATVRSRLDSMHFRMTELDWDDLRYLLALSRHGTLTAAAAVLGVTQPTVGRRLAALEGQLRARLFRSTPQGAELSAVGEALVRRAIRMEAEALEATRLASGRDAGVTGRLTITASEWLVARVLGPGLGGLLRAHPGLRVDLVASARWANLARGEADIALRPAAFQQQAVFQREVARVGYGLYAGRDYLRTRGRPDFARRCPGHALVTMDEDVPTADRPWLQETAGEATVLARTNGREGLAALA